ncbi:hypothetical protein QPK31_02690 [Massilia sp. YIM B02769]|uniref:hypothetical protein n=1 Tax=Massilia sp. YIM B02769 TaxID=3050129 RepID=UPI0025B71251|nr:hypothetical protein [Massilia sp. YIM B02769]MDN4057124.1 hypothetical protein [Massilia sp. YIM B02769]
MTDITKPESRPIPPLPGGGSWRFDDATWDWISNDVAPAEQAAETPSEPQE